MENLEQGEDFLMQDKLIIVMLDKDCAEYAKILRVEEKVRTYLEVLI